MRWRAEGQDLEKGVVRIKQGGSMEILMNEPKGQASKPSNGQRAGADEALKL